MNFTIKQSNQNPIFKKLKSFNYSYLTRIESKNNLIAKKVIREIKRDKNTQKVLFKSKRKKFEYCLQHPLTRERYDKISLYAFLQFP
ncbi:hypothetical protein EC526_05500 [Helicobacter pylori]|nr:hypothetical protein ECC47_05545 [Helicobacter pylori]RVZ09385.1 hypothetical protein EC526_05500 [Helicobacter pylori]